MTQEGEPARPGPDGPSDPDVPIIEPAELAPLVTVMAPAATTEPGERESQRRSDSSRRRRRRSSSSRSRERERRNEGSSRRHSSPAEGETGGTSSSRATGALPVGGIEAGSRSTTAPKARWGATLLEPRGRSRRHRSDSRWSGSTRSRVRTGWGAALARTMATLSGFACLALGAWLSSAHPLSSLLAVTAFVVLAIVGAALPAWAPVIVLPLLPLAGLMPWSGWLVVEEFDLLFLALAGGAYLRLALGWPPPESPRQSLMRAGWVYLPFALSICISLFGGLIDSGALGEALAAAPEAAASGVAPAVAAAGGIGWSWWQGYFEPLNSVRLAKPALAVALWLPLWRAASRASPAAAARRFELAMVGMGVVTALAVVAERAAFTGLLNFSTDYRATGPFWEMHVGGAALDAVLAATLPFMASFWWRARSKLGWAMGAAVVALGAYACIVTFSRIVYAAVPLALGVVWLVQRFGRSGGAGGSALSQVAGGKAALPAALFGALLFTALAAWFFPGAGWRGLLALSGALLLLLPLGHLVRGWVWERWAMAAVVAVLAMALVGATALLLPRGAYIGYALAFAGCAAAVLLAERGAWWAQVAAPALFAALLVALAAVAWHWGETRGIERALVVVVVLGGVLAAASREPLWPAARRWQGALAVGCVGIAGVVGAFGGGVYMSGRLADSVKDSQGRAEHWANALDLLRHPEDWLFGKGLGRYPAQQALQADAPLRAGDLRLVPRDEGGQAMALSAGTEPVGSNGMFRLSQRIAEPAGQPLRLRLEVRAPRMLPLVAAVCEKHLLYNGRCMAASMDVQPLPDKPWQGVEMLLKGDAVSSGPFWAPRWVTFSLSVAASNGRVEIDRVSLTDPTGRELLANGAFESGMARWFSTSDRIHLPWHAKNMPLHVLFEQGLFGLGALALLALVALWRVTGGAARRRSLAAPLAGAWVGVMTVGLFDSLFDMPRVGFVILMLLTLAVALPAGRAASSSRSGAAPSDGRDEDDSAPAATVPDLLDTPPTSRPPASQP